MFQTEQVRVDPLEEDAALALLAGAGSWRQYPAYAAEAARRVSASSRFLAIRDGGEAFAVLNLRTRRLPLGAGSSGLVSHGPVLLRATRFWQEDLDRALDALARHARETGEEIRIDCDPAWSLAGISPAPPGGALPDAGSRPYRTIVLPIGDGADRVRSRLHGKWRTTLRQAERSGLRIVVSDDPADFARMRPMLSDLMARKGFTVNQDADFFARVAAGARGQERILITLVLAGDEVVSAHVGAYSGSMACYLLGATSDRGRDLRAAYAAQWSAIGAAIGFGQQWYDLGGVDPAGNPDVYRFKNRMGGREVFAGGALILPPSGWRACSTRAARIARRMLVQ